MHLTALAHLIFGWSTMVGCTADLPSLDAYPPQALMVHWDTASPVDRDAIRKALDRPRGLVEPWLLEALRTGSTNQRLLACVLLERAGGPDAEAALIDALDDSDPRVQAQAMLSLAAFGGPAAAAAVRERLVQATDTRLVKAAIAALARLGGQEDAGPISAYLSDPDESVRVNAAAALVLLGDPSGLSTLLDATYSADSQARREATYALGFFDAPEAGSRIDEILADPQGRWRTEARMALDQRRLRHASEAPAPVAKHVTDVHGRGVLGDPDRSMTANAFAILDSGFYSRLRRRDTARGTVDEDIGARPINHFYNPVTGLNTMPVSRMGAVERAEDFWRQALNRYRLGIDFGRAGAFQLLGRSLHMLQDMTSPAHVHDDPHVPPLDPDDFEMWGGLNYPPPDVLLPGLEVYAPQGTVTLPDGRTVAADSPAGLVHGMAAFTYALTAIPGRIEAGRLQGDSELARMFPEGRLYYQDAGILGANYWQIEDVGRYGLLEDNDWWPCAGDFIDDNPGGGVAQCITGHFYIENVSGDRGGLVPAVFERPLRHLDDPAGLSLLEIYTVELYRESVSRSAAFLAAFERAAGPQDDPGGCAGPASRGLPASAGDTALAVLAAAVLLAAGRRRQ